MRKNSYKKSIYDYADEVTLVTMEEWLSDSFLEIASSATQNVWEMDIQNTIHEIKNTLDWIERRLNGHDEPVRDTCTGREHTTEALDMRNEVIRLTKEYYEYINQDYRESDLNIERKSVK
jgi:phosphoribulokinase